MHAEKQAIGENVQIGRVGNGGVPDPGGKVNYPAYKAGHLQTILIARETPLVCDDIQCIA
jgi:hypothetical protein